MNTNLEIFKFISELRKTYPKPGRTKSIQTDNGLDFWVFLTNISKDKASHMSLHTQDVLKLMELLRDLTVQEEFTDFNLEYLHEAKGFSSKLANYLIRSHKALEDIPPIVYLQKEREMSNKYWTYTLT